MKTIMDDKQSVLREFTVMAATKGQALELRITDMINMTSEFPNYIRKIYRDALRRMSKFLRARKEVEDMLENKSMLERS